MCGKGQSSSYGSLPPQSQQVTTADPRAQMMYQQAFGAAQQAAARPFKPYSSDPNAFVAPINPQQQMAIGNINQLAQTGSPYFQAGAGLTQAAGTTAAPQIVGAYMNPYTQAVAAPTLGLLQQEQARQLSQQQAQAIKSGAFGGTRADLERAYLQGQQGLAFGKTAGDIFSAGYQPAMGAAQADLQRQLLAGGQLGQLGAGASQAALAGAGAQLGAGTLQQQTQQAGLQALYNQFLQQQAYPFQTAQFLANVAGGLGPLYGGVTQTAQAQPYFSDPRLKDGIRKEDGGALGEDGPEPIGQTYDGQDIWRYSKFGRPEIGLMAPQVEERYPETVGDYAGYQTIDLPAATDNAAALGRARMGGAVDEPGDYARGGYAGGGAALTSGDLASILAAHEAMYGGMGGSGGGYGPSGPAVGGGLGLAIPKEGISTGQSIHRPGGVSPLPSKSSELMGEVKNITGLGRDIQEMYELYKGDKADKSKKNYGGRIGYDDGGPAKKDEVPTELSIPTGQIAVGKSIMPESGPSGGGQQQKGGLGSALSDIASIGKDVAGLSGLASGIGSLFGGASGTIGALGGAPLAVMGGAGGLAVPTFGAAAPAAAGIGSTLMSLLPSALAFFSDPRLKSGIREGYATKGGVDDVSDEDMDRYLASLAKIESGGAKDPYSVLGPETKYGRAIGKYQILPTNVPSWSEAAGLGRLTPEQFRGNKKAQEAVARYQFGQYLKQSGVPDEAAAMWIAGPGYKKHMGARDVLGTSIPEYQARFRRGLGEEGGPLALAAPEKRPSSPATDALDKMVSRAPSPGFSAAEPPKDTRGLGAAAPAQDVAPTANLAAPEGISGFLRGTSPEGVGERALDFLTSERFLIPALKGLGAMASSPSRYLGSAILQGVGAGAGAYMDVEKQRMEALKDTLGIMSTRFSPTAGGGFYDNVLGKVVSPAERMQTMRSMFGGISGGLSPSLLPYERPAAAPVEGKTEERPPEIKPALEAAKEVEKPLKVDVKPTPTAVPTTAQEILSQSEQDPRVMENYQKADAAQAQADRLEANAQNLPAERAQAIITQANTLRSQAQVFRERGDKLRDTISGPALEALKKRQEKAIEQEAAGSIAEAKGVGEATADNYKTFSQKASAFMEDYPTQKSRIEELNAIYQQFQSGRGTEAEANLFGYMQTLGIPTTEAQKKIAAGFDAAYKSAVDQSFQQMKDSGATKAPATGLREALLTSARPDADPAAVYKIQTDKLAALNYSNDMYQAFADSGETNVNKFVSQYQKSHPFKEYLEKARAETKPFKGMTKAGAETTVSGMPWGGEGLPPALKKFGQPFQRSRKNPNLFRNTVTGKIYNASGEEVKQ